MIFKSVFFLSLMIIDSLVESSKSRSLLIGFKNLTRFASTTQPSATKSKLPQHRTFTVTYLLSPESISWKNKQGQSVFDGPDTRFRYLLQNALGSNLTDVKSTNYEDMKENIRNGSADFLLTFSYITQQVNNYAEFTMLYRPSTYCMVLRRAPMPTFGVVLIMPFQPLSWLAIFGALLATACAWHAVHRLDARGRRWSPLTASLARALSEVAQMALASACSRPARGPSQRMVLMALLASALVLGNAYSGQLLGFLASPPSGDDPRTLADALPRVKEVFIDKNLQNAFDDVKTPELTMKMKFNTAPVTVPTLKEVINKGDSGVFFSENRYEFFSRYKELTEEGQRMLHLVPQCVLWPGHRAASVGRRSRLRPFLLQFALRISESGLYAHWEHMQFHHMAANGVTIGEGEAHNEATPLTPEQLEGPFLVLGLGVCGAALVFLLEHICRRPRCLHREVRAQRQPEKNVTSLPAYRYGGRQMFVFGNQHALHWRKAVK